MEDIKNIEDHIIGALLLEREAIIDVADILKEEHFYSNVNRYIYKHIIKLHSNSEPIDLLTVSNSLRKENELDLVGGVSHVSKLTNLVGYSDNISDWAKIVIERYIIRELDVMGLQLSYKAQQNTTDPFDLIAETEKKLFEINGTNNIQFETIPSVFFQFISQDESKGVSTGGLLSINKEPYYGSENGNLIIIAARPAMGKTAFAISNMIEQAKQGYPCAFYSLEMTKTEIMARIMSILSGVSASIIQRKKMNPYELELVKKAYEEYRELPILLSDRPALSILEIKTSARRLANKGVKSIYIDQLNHISHKAQNRSRNDEVGDISRAMKHLAKELNIPIHLLHQLNRSVETRGGDKKPNMSDLRDSGNVEQDADKIWLIHRPEYYGLMEEADGSSTRDMATIIVAKNRGGETGEIKMGFAKHKTQFHDIEQIDFTPTPRVTDLF